MLLINDATSKRCRRRVTHTATALAAFDVTTAAVTFAAAACAPLAGSLRPRGLPPLVRQGLDPVASSGRIRQWVALSRRLVGQCAKVRSESAGICKSRALGPLQRGAPPGQDIGSAGGAEQASSDVDDSTSGDECRCALSGSNTGDQYINAAARIVWREDKISRYVFILPGLPMRSPFDDIRGARSNVRWECVDHLWSAGCSCLLHRRLQEPMFAAHLRRLVMHFVQGWTGAY